MTAPTKVSFDPFSDDFFLDPYPLYARMRDEAPVYYNDQYGFYALTRHADVTAAFKDYETYSSAHGVDLAMVQSGEVPPVPMVIMLDPPDHRRMRSLVNRVFTPNAVKRLEPMVREVISGYLSQLDPANFDAVEDFSALFPCDIIARMLGVPEEYRQQVRLWLDISLHREPGQVATSPEGIQAGIETGMMYYDLIQKRRGDPQDDMISALIAVEVERDDGSLTHLDDAEIAGFASLLGGAGAETVTKLIGNAAVTFANNPNEWRKLLDDRSKVPNAIEELLRYEAPAQYVVRYCTRDVELHGTTIPQGSPVFVIAGSANRDERAFPAPDVFDIDRPRDQSIHVGLGYGIHSCLGAALARMESRIALELLLDFMPRFEIDPEGLRRVAMSNVAGWCNVPVRVLQ
ncbi:MAG TPA: cytochrome P450 [Mycobacteriales bacterium]|nr:cytochrome P450 [Mycobacteriales bacterium]